MIEAGTQIICPNPRCEAPIAETTTAIVPGMMVQEGLFKSIGGVVADGAPMTCHRCGTPYYYNGKIHTAKGWRP